MSLEICTACGKEFLTESDPYMVVPRPHGVDLTCGCAPKAELDAANQRIKELEEENEKLRSCQHYDDPYCNDNCLSEKEQAEADRDRFKEALGSIERIDGGGRYPDGCPLCGDLLLDDHHCAYTEAREGR